MSVAFQRNESTPLRDDDAAMKELRSALYVTIFLGIVSENLSFGSQLAIERNERNRVALFHKVKEGEALKGHVIAMHQICSELECLNRCLSLEKCVSFNFGLKTLGSRHPCELNSVTRALFGQALKIRKGFSYYEPIPLPQQDVVRNSLLQDEGAGSTLAPADSTPTFSTTPPALIATSTSSVITPPQPSTTSNNILSSTPVQPAEQVIDCSEEWHQYRTGCIRFFGDHKTREQARTYCQGFQTSNSVQANLVKILSQEDNDRIVSLASVQGEYFIGLGDYHTEGVYKWIDGGLASYTNWGPSEPQAGSHINCAVISITGGSSSGKWISKDCTNSYLRFICECPGACNG